MEEKQRKMKRPKVLIEIIAEMDTADFDDDCDFSNPEQLVEEEIDCVGLERAIAKGYIQLLSYEVKGVSK